jgi:hypothetical protein
VHRSNDGSGDYDDYCIASTLRSGLYVPPGSKPFHHAMRHATLSKRMSRTHQSIIGWPWFRRAIMFDESTAPARRGHGVEMSRHDNLNAVPSS